MLIELKEETWEYKKIKKLEDRYKKKFIQAINDEFYISIDTMWSIIDDLNDDLDFAEEKILKFDEKLNERKERKVIYCDRSVEF